MLILISPAKTLDFETPPQMEICTQPDFLEDASALMKGLSKLSEGEVGELMGTSPKLAKLNKERFGNWTTPFTEENAKQAALAFKGDVYAGMKAWEFDAEDFAYAQKTLRILSGLYGLLRPLDLMQPYRLEMGTVYPNPRGKDLYAFWGDRLAKAIDEAVAASGSDLLVNLASQEYFKAARANTLK
ncbi:MAG: peroxide stress protein YaaA, partial [Opitutales bacterium]